MNPVSASIRPILFLESFCIKKLARKSCLYLMRKISSFKRISNVPKRKIDN